MAQYDVDVSEVAAWLENQGPSRLWTVDGEPILSGELFLPCTGSDLARALLAHGGMLRVIPPLGGMELSPTEALSRANFEKVGLEDDGLLFVLAWLTGDVPGPLWILVEDTVASAAYAEAETPSA